MEDVLEENRSRYSVLVIEDNMDFAANAIEDLKKRYSVTVAGTLKDALVLLESGDFNYILSGVRFPADANLKPEDLAIHVIAASLRHDVPLCFVTHADKNGMVTGMMEDGEPEILIKALSFSESCEAIEKCLKDENPKSIGFNQIKSDSTHMFNKPNKDQVIWAYAMLLLQNISVNTDPLSASMKKTVATFENRFQKKETHQTAKEKA
jgi:DNA-binding NtrC family response regulator